MGFTGRDDIISEQDAGKFWLSSWWNRVEASMTATDWSDPWTCDGNPEPGTLSGTALTLRQLDDTVAGAILHGGNVSPDTKHIIFDGAIGAETSGIGKIWCLLYDRVATYENCPIRSTPQTMINVLTPQRYAGAGQPGLQIMVFSGTGLTGIVRKLTDLTYVNQAGTGSRSAPLGTIGTSAPANSSTPSRTVAASNNYATSSTSLPPSPFVTLATGDSGVRSITGYTFSASDATGTVTFVLGYPLAWIALGSAISVQPVVYDRVRQALSLPRLFDGAHPSIIVNPNFAGGSGIFMSGFFGAAWG